VFRDPELLHLLGAVSNDLTITALVLYIFFGQKAAKYILCVSKNL
jgi:hypothetical protein